MLRLLLIFAFSQIGGGKSGHAAPSDGILLSFLIQPCPRISSSATLKAVYREAGPQVSSQLCIPSGCSAAGVSAASLAAALIACTLQKHAWRTHAVKHDLRRPQRTRSCMQVRRQKDDAKAVFTCGLQGSTAGRDQAAGLCSTSPALPRACLFTRKYSSNCWVRC